MQTVFWLSLGLIVYGYAGYPLLLYLLGRVRACQLQKGEITPRVSFVIAAYNEESGIAEKLENTLGLDYPPDLREVILVSDGSTDRTQAIAESYGGVCTISLPQRMGKSLALSYGVKAANGEILVFTDVGTLAEDDCLRNLVANFTDSAVGCVSTEDLIQGDKAGGGEGAYVKYEMLLRKLESNVGSCVAVSGSFCAIRRELCPVFPPYAATDMLSGFSAVKQGYRTISDPAALARMGAVRSHGDEFQRKVRTVLTGLSCLPYMWALMNPFRYGLFSLEILSHKILRWGGGLILIMLMVSNIATISKGAVFQVFLAGQVLAYALAVLGFVFPGLAARSIFIRLPLFFTITNLAALMACFRYLTGQRVAAWQPSKRSQAEEIKST